MTKFELTFLGDMREMVDKIKEVSDFLEDAPPDVSDPKFERLRREGEELWSEAPWRTPFGVPGWGTIQTFSGW